METTEGQSAGEMASGLQAVNTPSMGPVKQAERIASIDVLRGVAVLGILVMNIQSFSMIGAAYINPTAFGDLTGSNYWVWLSCHLFADRKFMTIFSLLFGAGILIMTTRCEETGRSAAAIHYRRNVILLAIGMLHGYLLWYGDILHGYALCAFFVFFFRRKRPRTLVILGLMSLAFASGMSMLAHVSVPRWPEEVLVQMRDQAWKPLPEVVEKELDNYRGSWMEQMPLRVQTTFFFETFILLFENAWRAGGLMLIGMALFKSGFLNAAKKSSTYVTMIALAGLIGLPITIYGVYRNEQADWSFEQSFFLGVQFNYWASLLMAGGWIGLVMLLCRHGIAKGVTTALSYVGRMAFTNYLLQTVICTTLFYGHGFGLIGKLERTQQFLIVLVVWAFLIVFSNVWLRRFRFGPAEWVWRSLTYWKPQPMSRAR